MSYLRKISQTIFPGLHSPSCLPLPHDCAPGNIQTAVEAQLLVNHQVAEDGTSFVWKTGAHRTGEQTVRIVLWIFLGVMTAICLVEAGAAIATPCSLIGTWKRADCTRYPLAVMIGHLDTAKLGLLHALGIGLFFHHFCGAEFLARRPEASSQQPSAADAPLGKQRKKLCQTHASSAGWTLTAGRDVFTESCRAFHSHLSLLFGLFIPMAMCFAGYQAYNAFSFEGSRSPEGEQSAKFRKYLEQTCGEGTSFCSIGFRFASEVLPIPNTLLVSKPNTTAALARRISPRRKPANVHRHADCPAPDLLDVMQVMMMLFVVCGLPKELWSPLAKRALRKVKDKKLGRAVKLPLLVLVLGAVNLCFLLQLFFRVYPLRETFVGVHILFAGESALLLFQLATVVWILVAAPAMRKPGTRGSSWNCTVIRATLPRPHEISVHLVSGLLSSFEWGKRHLQLTHLYAAIALLALPSELVSAVHQQVITWVLRAAAIALVFGTRDARADFAVLCARRESAFGLVVNASQLRQALRMHLEGKLFDGAIETYKASVFRMRETLAVSYRWQPVSVRLAESSPRLNMSRRGPSFPGFEAATHHSLASTCTACLDCWLVSATRCKMLCLLCRWQMETLAKVLSQSTALYVWIDCMSVPQQGCGLQKTLLTRMMAVYASAGAGTVALRSAEVHGERYHQRAWTTQEFCASKQLSVYSEAATDEDYCAEGCGSPSDVDDVNLIPRMSATTAEAGMVMLQREKHLSEHLVCKPVWLFRDGHQLITNEDVYSVKWRVTQFHRLSQRTHCMVAADKYRALFPLVRDVPQVQPITPQNQLRCVFCPDRLNSFCFFMPMGFADRS